MNVHMMPKQTKKVLESIWGQDIENMNNICRLCMGSRLLVNIFGSDGVKQQLALKIQRYLSILIKEEDEMPNKLCYHCATTLIEWHNLATTASLSNARLKDIIRQQETKTMITSNKSEVIPTKSNTTCIYEGKKRDIFRKLCNDDKSIDEESPTVDDNEISVLGSTSEFYLKSSTGIEMSAEDNVYLSISSGNSKSVVVEDFAETNQLEDNVYVSIGSGNSETVVVEDFAKTSQLENKIEIPIPPKCTNETFEDNPSFQINNDDFDEPLAAEEIVNTFEVNYTDQEGMPEEDPSGEIMVVFYNGQILTKNFQCMPFIEQSDSQANPLSGDSVEMVEEESCNSSVPVYDYDDLTEESVSMTDSPAPPGNEVGSTELLHVILNRCTKCREDVTEGTSHEVCNVVNNKNRVNDGTNNVVVVEYVSQSNQDQVNNEEVTQEEYLSVDLNANYQCSKCKEMFHLKSERLHHKCNLNKENHDFFVQGPFHTELIQKDDQCLCINSSHESTSITCSLHINDKLNMFCNNDQLSDFNVPISCSACGKTFVKRSLLTTHERTHQDTCFLCSLCGKELKTNSSLARHITVHNNLLPYECDTCGKKFKLKCQLGMHVLVHTQERNFTCEVCASRFRTAPLLKQHQLSHSGVRPYQCETCGAAFNRKGNLSIHKKRHIDGYESNKKRKRAKAVANGIRVQCYVCSKSFSSILTLKYHMGRHNGDKHPFDCDHCDKRFLSAVSYRTHVRIHTGERPYACSECEKTFRSAASLKQHALSLHSDEFPHECGTCDRKFKRLQSLIVHKRTHTGEKNHKCSECGRAFAEKGDMRKHFQTHDNAKTVRLKASLAL